jgi:hypothetical protein
MPSRAHFPFWKVRRKTAVTKPLPDARQLPARNRTNSVGVLDGRSKEGRRIKTITADLVAHLGGPARVTPAQRCFDRAGGDRHLAAEDPRPGDGGRHLSE